MKLHRKIIYLAGFIFSLPVALTSYINSSFLEGYMNDYYVSLLYVAASALTIWGFLLMPRLLTRFGNRSATFLLAALLFVSLILLAYGSDIHVIAPAFIVFFIASNMMIATLDIFIENFSLTSSIGTFRGLYLMIVNAAWVLAQMVSGSIIAKSSYKGIYLISALFMFIVVGIFVLFLQDFTDPIYKKISVRRSIGFFMANKHLSQIYFINFILKFFFAWMIIYTPIYLHEYLHFNWSNIGVIFTIMLLPFVLLSYPLGKFSDKAGEKQLLKTGFLISALCTVFLPLIAVPNVWIFACVLFFTRVGASTIETMSESYFFKSVSAENADAISFFRNTTPLSYIVAPLLALPILYFMSFEYIFVVLAGFMLVGYLLSSRLQDVR